MKKILFYMILLFLAAFLANAEEMQIPSFEKEDFIATAGSGKTIPLTMEDCVRLALENNSEIQVSRINPGIAQDEVLIQKSAFKPNFTANFLIDDVKQQSTTVLQSTATIKTRTGTLDLGLDQKFVTGTELSLDFDNSRSRANSIFQSIVPMYETTAGLSVTQPILKGFGVKVTKAQLMIARNNKSISIQQFIQSVIDTLSDVKKKYYEYQSSREIREVAEKSLERVRSLHRINLERYDKGLASNVDLLESESEVAYYEEALIAADNRMRLAEDDLRMATNLVDDPALWDADLIPADEVKREKKEMDLVRSINEAFENRPDYKAAMIDLHSKDISVMFNKNGLLPTLNLVGSYSLNGISKDYAKTLGHVGSNKYPEWTIGAEFSMPLGNEKEWGNYEKAALEKRQALIKFKRLEQKIVLEVRNAVRNVMDSYKMAEASRKSYVAEQEEYDAQATRFTEGLVSTHDIVLYQEDLAKKEAEYVKSVILYNKTLVELERIKGTLLKNDNIKVE